MSPAQYMSTQRWSAMLKVLLACFALTLACSLLWAQDEEPIQLAETWGAPYTGEDATGDHVVGLWTFDAGADLLDASGNGHDLTLNGAEVVAEGRFGGALESWRGYPDEDTAHQARVQPAPELTPKGPFTVEMWIKPKADLDGYPESFLLDNRYVDETGMQFTLGADGGAGRRLRMSLGMGDVHPTWSSNQFVFEADVWHHIAFTYDGKGSGRFFIDGTTQGGEDRPEHGAVATGVKPLNIGDRVGSLYHGFPGYIDQVRICTGVLEFGSAAFEVASLRRVFVRMEEDATVSFAVINKQREVMNGAKASFLLGGVPQPVQLIPDLAEGEKYVIDLELDTSLRPDVYRLAATIDIPGERPFHSTQEFEITLVPRPLPKTMPVCMWGGALGQIDWLTELGFTHSIGGWADFNKIWEAGEPTQASEADYVEKSIASLDDALAHGIHVQASLSPGRWARGKEEFRRVGEDGKPVGEDVCGLFPEVQEFCYNVGASVSNTYGDHPAMDSALVHTEVRGATRPCFHEHDREAFRQASGLPDIPEGVGTQRGTPYANIADFPIDRVIPDNYPLLVYYQWFWGGGDGWNALHTALHNGLKSGGNDDMWTYHDPAARVASRYGNGGDVDYLSHWTYSYPDPIRIGLCADELFCMAGGADRDDQQVMKMTQIIWYRNQTAPQAGEEARVQTGDFQDQDVRPAGTGSVDASGRYVAAWESEIPDARFITIAPMHLREALWTKIARPIQGIMYHGWQSLVPLENVTGSYRYTNPDTKWELKRLVETVIQPLGPTLMEVPDRPSDVAFLESFSSQMFAQRGTYGWNGGWAGDAYLILHYAGLQPRVIYDETVEQEGLDAFKVLVMADCDVLTEAIVERVQAFQNAGGIIIGDENLCPRIKPDILLPTHGRPKEADEGRRLNIEAAAAIRAELDAHYQRYAESSTPDVITRVRTYRDTDYLFAVNDLREYGDYVGHHGLVMENGLPTDAVLSIRHPGAHAYNLVTHREVAATSADGALSIAENFGPCEGRLFMVTDQAIDAVQVNAPEAAAPGDTITVSVTVVGDNGRPMDAIVPVQIELLDPAGKAAEFSGYYAAVDGQVEMTALIAANDMPGLWRIHVTDLASGLTADAYMRLAATN